VTPLTRARLRDIASRLSGEDATFLRDVAGPDYIVERNPSEVNTREATCTQAIIECPSCKREVVTFVVGATSESLHRYHGLRCPQTPRETRNRFADSYWQEALRHHA
jgi:hypothetical protein